MRHALIFGGMIMAVAAVEPARAFELSAAELRGSLDADVLSSGAEIAEGKFSEFADKLKILAFFLGCAALYLYHKRRTAAADGEAATPAAAEAGMPEHSESDAAPLAVPTTEQAPVESKSFLVNLMRKFKSSKAGSAETSAQESVSETIENSIKSDSFIISLINKIRKKGEAQTDHSPSPAEAVSVAQPIAPQPAPAAPAESKSFLVGLMNKVRKSASSKEELAVSPQDLQPGADRINRVLNRAV